MQTISIEEFGKLIFKLAKSDRDVNMAIAGMTGEGKSTFATKLQKSYAKTSGDNWSFSRMTWSRNEMMEWIDGKKGSARDPATGLRENQLPEFSAILPDELFAMFYRRNWFNEEQIDAITTFNMCRDRHLFMAGNVPDFWELDKSFQNRMRFYIYIPYRGIAWVFEQENNPFSTDKWNCYDNKKMFRKYKNPSKCPNFVFMIRFEDWDPSEKKQYLKIRNTKRLQVTENKEKIEKYAAIKKQRNTMIRWLISLEVKPKINQQEIAQTIGMNRATISKIINNVL